MFLVAVMFILIDCGSNPESAGINKLFHSLFMQGIGPEVIDVRYEPRSASLGLSSLFSDGNQGVAKTPELVRPPQSFGTVGRASEPIAKGIRSGINDTSNALAPSVVCNFLWNATFLILIGEGTELPRSQRLWERFSSNFKIVTWMDSEN
ncbi:hypothetical protein C8J57DRAFT_1250492 [Mycena rebaudengoi]|nr:hypothetical protein C8J57DRAFT_1250492 [Mycena rebaudengoi]